MKTKFNISMLFILLAASLWGTAGIFVRAAEDTGVSEMQIVSARAVFSLLILGIVMLIKDRTLFKVKPYDLPFFVSAGVFSIVLFNFCYYKTMSLTSLSVAAVLLYTAPFFVVVMSVFLFGQRLTVKKAGACILAFVGCCFVSGIFSTSERISGKALVFGILTGFGYSLYTIFSEILIRKGYRSLTITFYTFVFAAAGCLPFINIGNMAKAVTAEPKIILITFLMAIFNTVIPYILYTAGLSGVEASTAPIIATLEPVVATIIGFAVFKETLTLSGAAGILMVLASVLILNLKAGKTDGATDITGKRKNQSDARNNRQAQ